MVLAKRGATHQDVLDAPENMIAEIIDGDLHLSPRPAKPHSICASVLGMALRAGAKSRCR